MRSTESSAAAGGSRRRFTTSTLMWIAAVGFFLLWVGVFLVWRHPGSFMHVFLVAAIGIALMNLVANYWSRE